MEKEHKNNNANNQSNNSGFFANIKKAFDEPRNFIVPTFFISIICLILSITSFVRSGSHFRPFDKHSFNNCQRIEGCQMNNNFNKGPMFNNFNKKHNFKKNNRDNKQFDNDYDNSNSNRPNMMPFFNKDRDDNNDTDRNNKFERNTQKYNFNDKQDENTPKFNDDLKKPFPPNF